MCRSLCQSFTCIMMSLCLFNPNNPEELKCRKISNNWFLFLLLLFFPSYPSCLIHCHEYLVLVATVRQMRWAYFVYTQQNSYVLLTRGFWQQSNILSSEGANSKMRQKSQESRESFYVIRCLEVFAVDFILFSARAGISVRG